MNPLRFWGKARPRDPNRGPGWHPLAFHSIDVAAVGEALLAWNRGPGRGLALLLGLRRDAAVSVICFLLCLHDIGKFAKKFQAKVPSLYPDCFGDDPAGLSAHYDHGAGGAAFVRCRRRGVQAAGRDQRSGLAALDFCCHRPPWGAAGARVQPESRWVADRLRQGGCRGGARVHSTGACVVRAATELAGS